MPAAERALSEVMQTEIAVLGVDERLDLAQDLMRLGRVRHLPVVEHGKLVGIVSSRDVLAASLARVFDLEESHRRTFLRSVEVREVMSSEVFALEPSATLREAAQLMIEHKIGCVPVVRSDRTLVGLVTESDLLRVALVEDAEETQEKGVEGVMTDVGERFAEELDAVRRVRDELRVRMHLAKAEVKDLWDSMEHKFEEVESKAKRVSREAEAPLHDVGAATRALLHEIREGYRRIREAL